MIEEQSQLAARVGFSIESNHLTVTLMNISRPEITELLEHVKPEGLVLASAAQNNLTTLPHCLNYGVRLEFDSTASADRFIAQLLERHPELDRPSTETALFNMASVYDKLNGR